MKTVIRSMVALVSSAILLGSFLPALASAQVYTYPYSYDNNYNYNYGNGTLMVYVQINSQYGNSVSPSNFTFYVSGANVSQQYFTGSQNGTSVWVSGNYNVSVYNQSGYMPSYSSGCSGTMMQGQTQTCYVTLTNSYNYNNTYPYNNNYYYPQYQYTQPVTATPVTVVSKYIPSLPDTGFAPVSSAALAFSLALILTLVVAAFPYVRKAFAVVIG